MPVESRRNHTGRGLTVSAVILHYHREELLSALLARLRTMPVDEVVVVDNGSAGGLAAIVAPFDRVRLVEPGRNLGVAGRAVAAREASGDLLLMLDDDAFPLPGAVEAARAAFERLPRLGVVGGLVRDVDATGRVIDVDSVGGFRLAAQSGPAGTTASRGLPGVLLPGRRLVRSP